jgi:hypothetical protein
MSESCAWLESLLMPNRERRAALVRRAHADIGIEESASAANRSPYLDGIAREFGSPVGSAWCALIVGRWCREANVPTPPHSVGAVRAWRAWAEQKGVWRDASYTPQPGDLVVYTQSHIGVVARVHARGVRTIEGNTSYAGFSREGVAVVYKPMATKLVAGFIIVTDAE